MTKEEYDTYKAEEKRKLDIMAADLAAMIDSAGWKVLEQMYTELIEEIEKNLFNKADLTLEELNTLRAERKAYKDIITRPVDTVMVYRKTIEQQEKK